MGTTFISINKNKGFYIAETFMQLVFHYIYVEAQKPEYLITNKAQFLDDMKFKIDGYAASYLTLGWNQFSDNESDTQVMLEVLQNVKVDLQAKGFYISVNELMFIPTEDDYFKSMLDKKPFPTAELIRVIDALILMLQGIWDSPNYDMDLNWRYS